MKTFFTLTVLLLSIFMVFSCDALDPEEDPNELGGDTNIPIAQVGNTAMTSFFLGDPDNVNDYGSVSASTEITGKDNNGVVNVKLTADLSNYSDLYGVIPAESKIGNNKIECNLKFKMTSEGWQEYFFNKNQSPQVMFKYDCKVGDTYSFKQPDGTTITRKVTENTGQDDFQYGLMYIKTIKLEQNSTRPGIKKYIYRANHKFGLVYFQAVLEDGTSAGGYITPYNY
ncbi:MAG: hypothetical protein GXO87_02115 [Chlorobi bacterium]|nr:hypothetical protein [Chlorobiota bacterium]